MNFGEKLAQLLEKKHVTLRQLAEASDLSIDAVRRACRSSDFRQLRPTTFQKLAKGLGMTVEQLHEATIEPATAAA
jgi:transcriptional regulator with XRE-family HTH domain